MSDLVKNHFVGFLMRQLINLCLRKIKMGLSSKIWIVYLELSENSDQHGRFTEIFKSVLESALLLTIKTILMF